MSSMPTSKAHAIILAAIEDSVVRGGATAYISADDTSESRVDLETAAVLRSVGEENVAGDDPVSEHLRVWGVWEGEEWTIRIYT